MERSGEERTGGNVLYVKDFNQETDCRARGSKNGANMLMIDVTSVVLTRKGSCGLRNKSSNSCSRTMHAAIIETLTWDCNETILPSGQDAWRRPLAHRHCIRKMNTCIRTARVTGPDRTILDPRPKHSGCFWRAAPGRSP